MNDSDIEIPTNPIELLDLAVETAQYKGRAVSGWTLQRDEAGYAAWLYHEDDDWTPGHQISLSQEVEVFPSAELAARDCYLRAAALEPEKPEAEA